MIVQYFHMRRPQKLHVKRVYTRPCMDFKTVFIEINNLSSSSMFPGFFGRSCISSYCCLNRGCLSGLDDCSLSLDLWGLPIYCYLHWIRESSLAAAEDHEETGRAAWPGRGQWLLLEVAPAQGYFWPPYSVEIKLMLFVGPVGGVLIFTILETHFPT